ncbi:hypothetical protein H4W79_001181 [Nocardiopsis terrae]|uniref:YaaC-like Protein n=1 Tax=Nocardiopsis terrae TaxID=372655 RepID=A0ABR9HD71_9ACTN|nr:YaaC family protein [Nocardiopsis terrae]MBE1456967.1 hypothetical protein [Nocardiopsis terrae]
MKLPNSRRGEPLLIKKRELDFSFFPMKKTIRRWGLHSMLYAAEPWAVISGSISESPIGNREKTSAHSFVRQSQEYFRAAQQASAIETRPLLYYYSFLNLGKAISILRGRQHMVGKVTHGISPMDSSGYDPNTAKVAIHGPGGRNTSALNELHQAVEDSPLQGRETGINEIFAQSVVGHRLWRNHAGQPKRERFIPVEEIRWFHDSSSREIWTRVYVRRNSLSARNRTLTETLQESAMEDTYVAVKDPDGKNRDLHTFEQINSTQYTGRQADVIMENVRILRQLLWQTVTTSPPHRKFYLYLSPSGEARLPQWLGIYATFFWLGSLTRYQPVELLGALDSRFGPFLHEFLETQPSQLLYILASEAKRQDVAKPEVV